MFSGHSNQMNGVPVKISEKYKPPKKLALNQALAQRLANSEATVQILAVTHDFDSERSVLSKIADWQQMRHQANVDRHERIRLRQEERQKQLEQRQKQLLTAVSYPSAEDFSSDEDTTGGDDATAVNKLNGINVTATASVPINAAPKVNIQHQQIPFSPPTNYDKILEPMVMGSHQKHTRNKSIGKSPKINYSDFEDESSPFDNVELKTINDWDILAQVLNKTVNIKSGPVEDIESNVQTSTANHLPDHTVNNFNTDHPTDNYTTHGIQQSTQQLTQSTNQTIPQFYQYHHQQPSVTGTLQAATYFHFPSQEQQLSPDSTMYQMTEYSNVTGVNGVWTTAGVTMHPNHITSPYGQTYVSPLTMPLNSFQPPTTIYNPQVPAVDVQTKLVYSSTQQSAPPLRSKSVPDILKEFEEVEVSEDKRERVRNKSQSRVKTNIDGNANTKGHHIEKQPRVHSRKETRSSRSFTQLPASSQKVATNISAMGFPIDRVARIAAKIGNDEKKIIEHLISVGELLDLGFDENKISDALLRFDNNKDRALDFLIS